MFTSSLSPWPSFLDEEVDAVAAVIRSNRVNYWTGQECRHFETEFAKWADCSHAIALANGTVALDLALNGLKIGAVNGGNADDEVIVTPRTFIASISCIVNAGAKPVFADVDPDSGNISPATISAVISPKTKAVILVHLAGWPCDMDGIMELAELHSFRVIEDCAQAHGGRYKGRSLGSIGHISAWSFCQDKIMTTGGEGGMVTTNDRELWSRMWSFKDHGKSWDAVYERQHSPGFRWVHEGFGTNWRMLEVQGAIGRIQLRKMAEWTARRTLIASKIRAALVPFSSAVRVPVPLDVATHAYYRLYAYALNDGLRKGWDRDRIVAACTEAGAPVFQGSCSEVYLEKAFDNTVWRPKNPLPVARELGQTSVMFLTHPTITDEQLDKYCSTIVSVFEKAAR
jgi:dTDP-4-amino-4,6-dideoxygalactose transaminase